MYKSYLSARSVDIILKESSHSHIARFLSLSCFPSRWTFLSCSCRFPSFCPLNEQIQSYLQQHLHACWDRQLKRQTSIRTKLSAFSSLLFFHLYGFTFTLCIMQFLLFHIYSCSLITKGQREGEREKLGYHKVFIVHPFYNRQCMSRIFSMYLKSLRANVSLNFRLQLYAQKSYFFPDNF